MDSPMRGERVRVLRGVPEVSAIAGARGRVLFVDVHKRTVSIKLDAGSVHLGIPWAGLARDDDPSERGDG